MCDMEENSMQFMMECKKVKAEVELKGVSRRDGLGTSFFECAQQYAREVCGINWFIITK